MRNNSEIILNLDQWFRCCLKEFLSLVALMFSITSYAILAESLMGKINLKLF